MKTFFNGKLTFKHNRRVNLCNQINSTIFNGKKILIKNNITSCKNLFILSWSFKNGFEKANFFEMKLKLAFCQLLISSQSRRLQWQACY